MPWKTDSPKEQRWDFVRQWLVKKGAVAEHCRRWAISRKTAYKWIARFTVQGRAGLVDRRRVARQVHNRPSERWLTRIRQCRARRPHWGAPKLRWVLVQRFGRKGVPSEAAISRWLQHWGLSRKRRRPVPKGPVLARPKLTVARQPNDVWTVDFKGWFRTGDGTRVEPLTVRDLASRYLLAIVLLPRASMAPSHAAFVRIFRQYGLPRVIRADNGCPWGAYGALGLTRLSAWWVKLGICVEFIAPGRPDQNGAHEQVHRVYKAETLQPAAGTRHGQQRRSERWRRIYNHERPHETLNMRVPAARYRKSPRRFPETLKPWRYPHGWHSRRVKGQGVIHWNGRVRFIGEAFTGERVGLRCRSGGIWEVHFGPLLIGELSDGETGGIRAAWYRQPRHQRSSPNGGAGRAPARSARLRSACSTATSKVSPMR
jgi:putative transposase